MAQEGLFLRPLSTPEKAEVWWGESPGTCGASCPSLLTVIPGSVPLPAHDPRGGPEHQNRHGKHESAGL